MRGHDIADRLPLLANSFRGVPGSFLIDGELFLPDAAGRPDFNGLQKRMPSCDDIGMALKKSKRIERAKNEDPFPALARHLIAQFRLAGWRFENVGSGPPDVPLEAYHALANDARSALRMIRRRSSSTRRLARRRKK